MRSHRSATLATALWSMVNAFGSPREHAGQRFRPSKLKYRGPCNNAAQPRQRNASSCSCSSSGARATAQPQQSLVGTLSQQPTQWQSGNQAPEPPPADKLPAHCCARCPVQRTIRLTRKACGPHARPHRGTSHGNTTPTPRSTISYITSAGLYRVLTQQQTLRLAGFPGSYPCETSCNDRVDGLPPLRAAAPQSDAHCVCVVLSRHG